MNHSLISIVEGVLVRERLLYFVNCMKERMTALGFAPTEDKSVFSRQLCHSLGTAELNYSTWCPDIIDRPSKGYEITLGFAVWHRDVQRLASLVYKIEKPKPNSIPTIAATYEQLLPKLKWYTRLLYFLRPGTEPLPNEAVLIHDRSTPKSIDCIVMHLCKVVRCFGIPFLEKYDDLKNVNEFVNESLSCHPFYYDIPRECTIGLIAAKLCQSPNYTELEERYRSQLAEYAKGRYLPQFDIFLRELRVSFPSVSGSPNAHPTTCPLPPVGPKE